MNKKLTLHEAIEKVLQKRPQRTGHIEEVANRINNEKLYQRKDGSSLPPYQVKMRTKLAKGRYHHLFEYLEGDFVKLR
jgi:hypothetical protein